MPELAEVAYHCSIWSHSVGERVTNVAANARSRCLQGIEQKTLQTELNGEKLVSAETHGKQMLFQFGSSAWLGVHLGMTGKLLRESPKYAPTKHDHLVIRTNKASLIFNDYRMFGKVLFETSEGGPKWWNDLPPSILSKEFDASRFEGFAERRKGSNLKAFLLKQDAFPGIGNWMADEILWKAGIDPRRSVGSLSAEERRRLYRDIRFVCRGAMRTVGVDYRDPPSTWLFKHRWKDGGRCPKTGEPLVREKIGGRTTCWSPARQR